MNEYGDAYFNQTKSGSSTWLTWLAVFWFTFLGWIIVQLAVGPALNEALLAADPEGSARMQESMTAFMAGKEVALLSYFLLFAVSTALGLICFLINRLTSDSTRKVFGILTGLCILGSFAGMFMIFPLMNDPTANKIMGDAMGKSAVVYALFLFIFPLSLIALYLGQKFIHKRSIKSLHTAARAINWTRGLQAFFVTWLVLGLVTAIGHFSGISPINTNFDAGRFAIYALISIIFLPMQSGTEEIVFRGYLNQGFNHFIKNKWVVFTITSLLFMAVHLGNPEALAGKEGGMLTLVMSSYFLFGFVACLMVWMDDGLESAIGFHAANNTFAAIFVNYEGSVLPTPSLFMAKQNPGIDIPISMLALAIILFILYKTRKTPDYEPLSVKSGFAEFD